MRSAPRRGAPGAVLPESLTNFGPSYLRWRADAIARGEVASGKGSKFEASQNGTAAAAAAAPA